MKDDEMHEQNTEHLYEILSAVVKINFINVRIFWAFFKMTVLPRKLR